MSIKRQINPAGEDIQSRNEPAERVTGSLARQIDHDKNDLWGREGFMRKAPQPQAMI